MRNRLVRKYQPQDAVGIDWSNPLTQGLRALVNAAGAPRDAVTGRLLVNSGMTLTPYRGGSVYAATVAATTRIELPFDLAGPAASIHVIAARDASATGASAANPRSVAALFSDSTSGADPVFWEGNLGNSFGAVGDVNKPRFGTNAVGIGTIYRDGVALSGNNPATTALTNGQMYAMSFVASSGVTPSGTGKLLIFNARNLFTTDGRLQFFGLWDRALTAAEVRHLNENPWQLFAPRRIWVSVAAAGSTFKSAWARGCNTVISSGARP